MSAQDNAQLARELIEAFNDHNLDRWVERSTDDVEAINVPFGLTFRGPEELRQFLEGWIRLSPDGQVEVTSQLPGDEGITNENVYRGTFTGTLATPTGVIEATGKSFEMPFVEVWRIREGKLASIHAYFDTATMMQRLGVVSSTEAQLS